MSVEKLDVERFYEQITRRVSRSFPSRMGAYVTTAAGFDSENSIVGAWVYMDPSDRTKSMKTIFGNKAPGCETGENQNGYAVYVNGWETADQFVYAEWGGVTSGCHKISSEASGVRLQPGKWYHVAMVLGSGSVALYVNGDKVSENTTSSPCHIRCAFSLFIWWGIRRWQPRPAQTEACSLVKSL